MKYPEARLLLFARRPRIGRVKTRIARRIGDRAALRLYEALLTDSLRRLTTARLAPLQCWCHPDCDHHLFSSWRERVSFHRQRGGDLGERMFHATERALGEAEAVVLLGTDCPDLDAAYLQQALQALCEGCDLVIGPARDGGYVLLGLRRAERALFESMPWGSDRVAALTRARAQRLGLRVRHLPLLRDVDEWDDLKALPTRLTKALGPGWPASETLIRPGG